MALQLSNIAKNQALEKVIRPTGTSMYVMIPAPSSASNSTALPIERIIFGSASNGTISLTRSVQLTVASGTKIDKVYLNDSSTPLTKASAASGALLTINLTNDDIEEYDNNGVYIINTLNIALNT